MFSNFMFKLSHRDQMKMKGQVVIKFMKLHKMKNLTM